MKRIKGFTIILLIFFSNLISAAENNIIFEKANELYHNKYYDSAVKLYQQMIEDGYNHPDLYYNAGNAYYRSNKTGMAVWCFKKALLIDDNKNYRDNLLLAQKKIEKNIRPDEEIFFMRWWKNMYNMMSVNQWAITTLVFFLITMLLLGLRNILQKNIASKSVVKVFIAFTCFSLLFLSAKYYNAMYHYHGIIVENNTAFTSNSKSLSTSLSEGVEVEFISRKNSQLIVKLPDGRTGTIQEGAFKKL